MICIKKNISFQGRIKAVRRQLGRLPVLRRQAYISGSLTNNFRRKAPNEPKQTQEHRNNYTKHNIMCHNMQMIAKSARTTRWNGRGAQPSLCQAIFSSTTSIGDD